MAEILFHEFSCFCKHKKKGISPDYGTKELQLFPVRRMSMQMAEVK